MFTYFWCFTNTSCYSIECEAMPFLTFVSTFLKKKFISTDLKNVTGPISCETFVMDPCMFRNNLNVEIIVLSWQIGSIESMVLRLKTKGES